MINAKQITRITKYFSGDIIRPSWETKKWRPTPLISLTHTHDPCVLAIDYNLCPWENRRNTVKRLEIIVLIWNCPREGCAVIITWPENTCNMDDDDDVAEAQDSSRVTLARSAVTPPATQETKKDSKASSNGPYTRPSVYRDWMTPSGVNDQRPLPPLNAKELILTRIAQNVRSVKIMELLWRPR